MKVLTQKPDHIAYLQIYLHTFLPWQISYQATNTNEYIKWHHGVDAEKLAPEPNTI